MWAVLQGTCFKLQWCTCHKSEQSCCVLPKKKCSVSAAAGSKNWRNVRRELQPNLEESCTPPSDEWRGRPDFEEHHGGARWNNIKISGECRNVFCQKRAADSIFISMKKRMSDFFWNPKSGWQKARKFFSPTPYTIYCLGIFNPPGFKKKKEISPHILSPSLHWSLLESMSFNNSRHFFHRSAHIELCVNQSEYKFAAISRYQLLKYPHRSFAVFY